MPTETELLKAIAEHGERKHVLFQLAADGRDFCGAMFVAREMGIEGESADVIAKQFVSDVNRFEEENGVDWKALESQYGEKADEYC